MKQTITQGHAKVVAFRDKISALMYNNAKKYLGKVWSVTRLEAIHLYGVSERSRSIAKILAGSAGEDFL